MSTYFQIVLCNEFELVLVKRWRFSILPFWKLFQYFFYAEYFFQNVLHAGYFFFSLPLIGHLHLLSTKQSDKLHSSLKVKPSWTTLKASKLKTVCDVPTLGNISFQAKLGPIYKTTVLGESMVWLHCPGWPPNYTIVVIDIWISISIICAPLPRRHQDPAQQGEQHADPAQHEHLHRAEAGGGLQEHIPRKHWAHISGTWVQQVQHDWSILYDAFGGRLGTLYWYLVQKIWYFDLVHGLGTRTWYMELIHEIGTWTWYSSLVLATGTCVVLL